jgi:hypothetical protein
MKQLLTASLGCFVVLITATVFAGTHALPERLASVVIPSSWKVTMSEEGYLVASSPREEATLLLRDHEISDSPPPMDPPPPRPFGRVQEVVGEPERVEFQGFIGVLQHGKGKVGGEEVVADQILLFHELRKFAVSGWGYGKERGYDAERRKQIRSIVLSLRASN